MTIFNVSTRKVGGIRFLKIGRLTFSFCVSARYRPIGKRPVAQTHVFAPNTATTDTEAAR